MAPINGENAEAKTHKFVNLVNGEFFIIGIDKGIEVLQLYNYKNPNYVSSLAMKNPNVIQGFTGNGFTEVEDGIQG